MTYTKIAPELLERTRRGELSEGERKTLFVNADLSNADLSGVNLSHINFSDAFLFKTNFTGCELFGADFSRADATGAIFEQSNATEATFYRTGLGHTRFNKSTLFAATFHEASLTGATCIDTDFRTVDLTDARMRDTSLLACDFTSAKMIRTDLSDSDVTGSEFHETCFQDAQFRGMTGYRDANWIGADIRQVNFSGSYRIRRVILDQNYLEEFRRENRLHEFYYQVWRITSDCGRSMGRWTLLVVLGIIFFGILYTFIPIDMGIHPTPFSPFYFSVVTMTTLGFGDVIPKSVMAQIIVSIQVLIGYIMLGGLLAILTNKLARRAD